MRKLIGHAWGKQGRTVRLLFEPRDCWIGVFWEAHPSEAQVYITLIPMLVLHVWWPRRSAALASADGGSDG